IISILKISTAPLTPLLAPSPLTSIPSTLTFLTMTMTIPTCSTLKLTQNRSTRSLTGHSAIRKSKWLLGNLCGFSFPLKEN
ncbi:hypothetical protein TorRG33x02_067110, partial [Trema orientale]